MTGRLEKLCAACGVGGERAAAEAVREELRSLCDEVKTFPLGSVAGILRCGRENAPLLMLEAHLDEIGFTVTQVDDGGFIRVAACGGIDRRVLASQEVIVYGEREIPGVFCATPPHLAKFLAKENGKLPPMEDFGIDTGLSQQELQTLVFPGTRVGFRPHFSKIGEHAVCAKALDNCAGCEAVLRALELLKGAQVPCDIAALFAVQEEIGGAGAKTAAFDLMPDAAIVTDVSFALTPDAPPQFCGIAGKGAMLGFSPNLDAALTQRLLSLAQNQQIPFQQEVMGSDTGTDADLIALTRTGVKTALISIPLRYMHTPNETVDLRDIESTAQWMAAAAKEGVA